MRKNTSFAVAAAMIGLAVIFWARSSVVARSADVRTSHGVSSYVVGSGSYLPFAVMEPVY
ncbi:MAG TPA: hypothetical protein VH678_11890 [Xanthobacteraceae bacterium]|jgi:hypothetical protein